MVFRSLYSVSNHLKSGPLLPSDNVQQYYPPTSIPKRFHRVAVGALLFMSLSLVSYVYKPGRLTKPVDVNVVDIESVASVEFTAGIDPELPNLPPLYKQYSASEDQLPQHNLNLPFPDGRHAKYVWFSNHVTGVGWGNHMQELLMNAHLAYTTKRAYVFDNYTWDRDGPEYSTFNGKLIPSRIPLSAMISGPVIGAPFPDNDVPRAVSKNFFHAVCPNRTVIDSLEVNEHLRLNHSIGTAYIFSKWVEKLNSIEDACVEIAQDSPPIFEFWLFGSRRILDIWDSLRKSPILIRFDWSPLVHLAFKANVEHFQAPHHSSVVSSESYDSLPGLLTLHIRRGDFLDHCIHLANWSADWNGFNKFPDLFDQFDPPEGGGWGINTPENYDIYLKHCLPSIEQIVAKVADVSRVSLGLRYIYILTNAPETWLAELKGALRHAHNWHGIASSRDLNLSQEQKYVSQMVDMMIAERAQVFVGNGFSSLSSNIVMLRLARGHTIETNRLW